MTAEAHDRILRELDQQRARLSRVEWLLSMRSVSDIKHALLSWEHLDGDGPPQFSEKEAEHLARHIHDTLGKQFAGIAQQPEWKP